LISVLAVALFGPLLVLGAEPAAAVEVPPVPTSAMQIQGDRQQVVTDGVGNSYQAGIVIGTGTFGTGPKAVAYTAGSAGDAFVASFDATGAFRWVIIGSNVFNAGVASDLAIDGAGNVYVVGTFAKRITFDTTTIGDGLGNHAFLLKVSEAGTVAWVKDITGGTSPTADHVAATPAGAYLVGSYQTSLAIDGAVNVTTVGFGGYIARVDAAGTPVWAQNGQQVRDVGTLPSGDAVVLGTFGGNFTLGSITVTSFAYGQVYLGRVGPTGSTAWLRSVGAPNSSDYAGSLSIDGSGRISFTLASSGEPKFGTITVANTWSNGFMLVVARYNSLGIAQWASRVAGVFDVPNNQSVVMTTLVDGAVVFGLYYGNTTSVPKFGPTGVSAHGTGSNYLASIAPDGSFRWAERFTAGPISGLVPRVAGGFGVILQRGSGGLVGPSDIGQLVLPLVPATTNFIVDFPAQYTGPGANLGVNITGPIEAVVGQNVMQRITARNGGLDAEPNASVSGITSSGLVVVGAVPSKGSVSGDVWTIGPLASGETATLDLTLRRAILGDCQPTTLSVSIRGSVFNFDLERSDNDARQNLTFTMPPQTPGGGLEWAQAIHGLGDEGVTDVAVTPTGDLLATGHMSSSSSTPVTFAIGTPQETQSTSTDHTFLARFAPDGTLQWLNRFGGVSASAGTLFTRDVAFSHVSAATDGSSIVAGTSSGSATFDGKSAGTPQNLQGGFVVHYTSAGGLDWVTPIGAGAINDVGVAADGSIFVVSSTFTQNFPSPVVYQAKLTKLSPTGGLLWSVPAGGAAVGLEVDAAGVHLAGWTYGATTFGTGPTAVSLTSNGTHDITFSDFDTDGGVVDARLFGGPDNDTAYFASYRDGSWYVFGRTLFNFWLQRIDADGSVAWTVDGGTTDGGSSPVGQIDIGPAALTVALSYGPRLVLGSSSGASGGSTFEVRSRDDGTSIDSSLSNVAALATAAGPDGRLYSVGRFSALVGRLPAPPSSFALCNMSSRQPGVWDDYYIGADGYLAAYTLQGSLAGTATDGTGTPMGGITVTVMREWPSWVVAGTVQTSADGTWRIDDLPVGRYRVRFRDLQERSGWLWSTTSPTYRAAADVVVQMAKTTTIDVALPALPDTVVAGRVTDAVTGLPIEGAHIAVFDASGFVLWATSGANGYYGIRGLPSKTYKLWIRGPNLAYVSEWFDNQPTAAVSNNVSVGVPGTAGSRVQANVVLQPKP
jgi:hypothetical protein